MASHTGEGGVELERASMGSVARQLLPRTLHSNAQ